MPRKSVKSGQKTRFCKVLLAFSTTPKPWVVGSSPSAPAKKAEVKTSAFIFFLAAADELSPSVLRRLENIVESLHFNKFTRLSPYFLRALRSKQLSTVYDLAYLQPCQKKAHICLSRQMCAFFNDGCLRQMILASPHFMANITSLRHAVERASF